MQAIYRSFSRSQNCNCYPHLFRCSTIKIHNFFQLPLKPSVALLSSHFNTLFSFQGAIRSFGSNRCFASQNCNFFFWNVPARPLRGGLYVALRAPLNRSLALKPDLKIQSLGSWDPTAKLELVGPSGLEPPTLRLSVVRSSQLSYGPVYSLLVEIVGIEPATSCLQGRRSPSWAISPDHLQGYVYPLN